MPLTWFFFLLIASLFLKKQAKKLRIASVILLLIFSNTFIAKEVKRIWDTPPAKIENLKPFSAAVVLGGFSTFDTNTDRLSFSESTDRLMQGLKLLGNERVNHLIISGGSGYINAPELRESDFVGQFLFEIGYDTSQIWLENESKNTKENAAFTAELLKSRGLEKEPILLITSAYHMRRAMACFEKFGLIVVPYAAESAMDNRENWLEDLLLPSAQTLTWWNAILHEWFGYISYKILGYL